MIRRISSFLLASSIIARGGAALALTVDEAKQSAMGPWVY